MIQPIEITKDFKFAHRGCDVVEYKAGDVIADPAAELFEVAIKNRWAKASKAKPESKAPPNEEQKKELQEKLQISKFD